MKQWSLMNGAVEPTGDGVLFAQNVSMKLEGEINRRYGLAYVASLGAKSIAPVFYPGLGYMAILFTSTGTVETVSL